MLSPLSQEKIIRYGQEWNPGSNDLEIELACFWNGKTKEQGGLGKAKHFENCVKLIWPNQSGMSTRPCVWHPWMTLMAEAFSNNKFVSVSGGASCSKCLAPHVKVLMFDGSFKRADEVSIGDRLMGDDSSPRTVLSVRSGRSNMVRINPYRGDSWECNDDHILTLKRVGASKRSWRRIGDIEDISVKDYILKRNKYKKQRKLFCVGVDFPSQKIECDPRMYGLWLGDGTTREPIITSHDKEIEINKYIENWSIKNGYICKRRRYGDRCPEYALSTPCGESNPFRVFIKGSVINGKKRIRKEYLINDRNVRINLLAGIIDSDGTVSDTSFTVVCSNDELAYDVLYLARSLGFRSSIRSRKTTCNKKIFQTNEIRISGDVSEIPTLRKKCRIKKIKKNSDCVGFDIEQLGEGDWNGFTLDGNGRFLLSDFTVTHNTECAALWAIVNFLAAPFLTTILVTSTTVEQSKLRIWGRICEYWSALGGDLPGRNLDKRIKLSKKWWLHHHPGQSVPEVQGIELVAAEKAQTNQAIQKLIGIKSPSYNGIKGRLILIADELPDLSPSILTASMSNLISNDDFQLIALGNYKSDFDAFGQFAKPKNGWGSVSVDDVEWETERGICIHLDQLNSPNWRAKENLYPMMSVEAIQDAIDNIGPNKPEFWRMIRSFPCPISSENKIYSEADLRNHNVCNKVEFDGHYHTIAGLDPSWTNGGDRCVFSITRFGNVNGLATIYWDQYQIFKEQDTSVNRSQQISNWVRDLCIEHGIQQKHLAVDATGGIVFCDMLEDIIGRGIYRVFFYGNASDKPVSAYQSGPASDYYQNRASEIWHVGQVFVNSDQLRINPEIYNSIAPELTARETLPDRVGKKTMIQSKKEMKSFGFNSPDITDSFLVALDLIRNKFSLSAGGIGLVREISHKRNARKRMEYSSLYQKNRAYPSKSTRRY